MDPVLFDGAGICFRVDGETADAVYLRLVTPAGEVKLLEMRPSSDDGIWQVTVTLTPGRYYYRYYLRSGASFSYRAPADCAEKFDGGWDAVLTVEPAKGASAPADAR